jgi:hypothetical protein
LIDASAAVRGLHSLESNLRAAARQALGQSVALALLQAKRTNTFHDRTGRLRSSIIRGERGPWASFVSAGGRAAPYGLFVEAGTRAHPIVARNARVLRFVQNGEVRYARRVQHPGTKPTHFMRDTRDAVALVTYHFVENGVARSIS